MKKGFTLIELLAVIVILAIIALIATPIVLSIISDSKESAQIRSAEMYLKGVEQAISLEKMNNTNFNPNSCTIENGNLNCEEIKVKVEVKGEVPKSGTITIEEGMITDIKLEYENDKIIIRDEEGNLTYNKTNGEQKKVEPGLYKEDGTFVSWNELLNTEITSTCSLCGGTYTDKILKVDERGGLMSFICKQCTNSMCSNELHGQLVLPNTVTSIDDYAFAGNNKLTSLIVSDSVTSIGSYSFHLCDSFEFIVIPESVTSIASNAFKGSDNMKTIYYSGTAINDGGNWDSPAIIKPYSEASSKLLI